MNELAARLALGTVQFGLDYGINNPAGRVPSEEVREILRVAHSAGIDLLDTAVAYGAAQSVIGAQLANAPDDFRIVSKIAPDARTPEAILQSVDRIRTELGAPTLYGLLVHDFDGFILGQGNWDIFRGLRVDGQVRKIGFSVYFPAQIDWLIQHDIDCDIIQLPYNVFDQRFTAHIARLKARGVEVHVRSTFLQGLFFVPDHELRPHFSAVASKLKALKTLARDAGIPLAAVLLGFSLGNPDITRVVIGVDSARNLQENIASLIHFDRVQALRPELERLAETDERILIPSNWS